MKRLIFLLCLISTLSYAQTDRQGWNNTRFESGTVDSEGNFSIVVSDTISGGYSGSGTSRMRIQFRPKWDMRRQGNYDGYQSYWINFEDQTFDDKPFLVPYDSRVPVADNREEVTYIGQVPSMDTSQYFSDRYDLDFCIMFIFNSTWDAEVADIYLSEKIYGSVNVTADPGKSIVVIVANESSGWFTTSSIYGDGHYQTMFEYYDDNDTSWKIMKNGTNQDWSDLSYTVSSVFLKVFFPYDTIYTDGQTRITYRDEDGYEGGPYAGPNIMGVDGITGTGP